MDHTKVLIDVTAAHFWDISGAGALDKRSRDFLTTAARLR
jgi:hypothetical protein